jgi:hypothetical protein
LKYEEIYSSRCTDGKEWHSLALALKSATVPHEEKLVQLMELWTKEGAAEESLKLYQEVHVYYMLWAYAIENLIKAFIVKSKSKSWTNNGLVTKIPKELKNHDLPKLVKESGLEYLHREYEDIFEKLKECIVWYGRYPIPLSANDYKKPSAGFRSSFTPQHIRDLNIIFSAIETEIKNSI